MALRYNDGSSRYRLAVFALERAVGTVALIFKWENQKKSNLKILNINQTNHTKITWMAIDQKTVTNEQR